MISQVSSGEPRSGDFEPPAKSPHPSLDALLDSYPLLAAHAMGCPVALIGTFDGDRQVIRARHCWNISSLPFAVSMARLVVEAGDLIVVQDTLDDSRIARSPLVVQEPRIRFYAGAPLRAPDGEIIGVLEVFDRSPRRPAPHQQEMLRTLAEQASAQLSASSEMEALRARIAAFENVEDEVREPEGNFRQIFDAVDDFVMSIHPDGRLLHFNASCATRLGHDETSLNGLSIVDVVHPSARGAFRADFDSVISSGEPGRIETTFIDGFGQKIFVEGTLTPRVIDEMVVVVRVIFRDITARKRMEVELGRARDEALESARLKSRFLSNVSHEIRTPVHAITGMLGLLSDTELTAEQRGFLHAATVAADSLLQIVNNILYASRLEAGKMGAALADFDLVGSVRRVVDVMQVAASEKGLSLDLQVEEELPAILRGDPGRYRQVLGNLIANAVKFTDTGTIGVELRIDNETDSHTLVRTTIRDSGIGIPEEARERLFISFGQVDSSASRRHDGLGLGLSIARQLVEVMGGAIGCDSREGQGSTFWFTIPFERRATSALAVAGNRMAFPGSRVMILDTSESSGRLIEHFVASWGMRHRSVAAPREVVERLRTEAEMGDPFQVLIAQLHYPRVDVLELVRTIREDPSIAETPIVLTTEMGEGVDDGALRAAGIASYLPRPVDKSELFDCLATAFAKGARSHAEIHQTPVRNRLSGAVATVPAERRADVSILIAEDKPLNQKLALSQLRSLGYSADVAANGVEVLDAVRAREYDVILMDCQMPLMDGYQTTIELRRDGGAGARTRIIAMTANALEGDREKCLAAGMDDYLAKPVRQEELQAALDRALTRA